MLAVITDVIGIIVIICCFREEFGAKGRGVCLPEPSVIALPDLANISPNQCVVYLKFIFNWCILSLDLNQLNLLEAGSGSRNREFLEDMGARETRGPVQAEAVCVCLFMCICVCISMHVCAYVYMSLCIYMCVYVCTCVHVYVYVSMCV